MAAAGKETSSRGAVPDFVGVLRRRWKPALLMFLLVVGGGIVEIAARRNLLRGHRDHAAAQIG